MHYPEHRLTLVSEQKLVYTRRYRVRTNRANASSTEAIRAAIACLKLELKEREPTHEPNRNAKRPPNGKRRQRQDNQHHNTH